jgi:hypothetical protein
MEERARFQIAYAAEHGPVTVRGLYYQAEVAGVPGIEAAGCQYPHQFQLTGAGLRSANTAGSAFTCTPTRARWRGARTTGARPPARSSCSRRGAGASAAARRVDLSRPPTS